MSDLFLFNERLLPLTEETDPRLPGRFPLPPEKAAELTSQQLIELLKEALNANPAFPLKSPKRFLTLCHLMQLNEGVNALRQTRNGTNRIDLLHTHVPMETFLVLSAIQQASPLTLEVVDEAIWDFVS